MLDTAVISGSGSVTVDKTAPTLNTVTIASNNSINTEKAKENDVITLSFTASETITTPTVSFSIGSTVVSPSVSGSGSNYTATYTVLFGQNGLVTFSISSYSDSAGNAGPTVNALTSGSTVSVDTTLPDFNATQPAFSDMKINTSTLKYTVTEDLSSGYIEYVRTGGTEDSSTHRVNLAGTQLETGAERIITNPFTLVDGAIYKITYVGVDLAGNQGADETINLTYDSSAPTLNKVTIASNNSINTEKAKEDDVITLTIVANETITQPTVSFNIGGTIVSPSVSPSGPGSNYTATYTVLSGQNGSVTFSISSYSDSAGNAG